MDNLINRIEAIIFVADKTVSLGELKEALQIASGLTPTDDEILDCVSLLKDKFKDNSFSFELIEIEQGFQFLTKPEYYDDITCYLKLKYKKSLSVASLETLAIIAYRQPVSKSQIEDIRGVSCDYSIQKLLEKELIEIHSRADTVGKPLLYKTSNKFMNYFGLKSLDALPQIKDFNQVPLNFEQIKD